MGDFVKSLTSKIFYLYLGICISISPLHAGVEDYMEMVDLKTENLIYSAEDTRLNLVEEFPNEKFTFQITEEHLAIASLD
jgi:hypothetical protein